VEIKKSSSSSHPFPALAAKRPISPSFPELTFDPHKIHILDYYNVSALKQRSALVVPRTTVLQTVQCDRDGLQNRPTG
jgi:hypothetical protein